MDGVSHNDPEVKKVVVHNMDVEEKVDLLKRLGRFSEWHRIKKIHCLDTPFKTEHG